MKIPNYLTRYYTPGTYPLTSLNDYSLEQANAIKLAHCARNNIGGYYARDEYLIHRRKIEKWIYAQLIQKGAKPKNDVPIYMTLGESPTGEYDICADIQRSASEVRISIESLDLSAVTFTYPDSMYKFIYDDNGNKISSEMTETPHVYLYDELPQVIEKYKVYDLYEHYIEAQVWDREMLAGLLTERTYQDGHTSK